MNTGYLLLATTYWIVIFLLFNTWIFYIILLWLIKLIISNKNKKIDYSYRPRVSFIIAAHNEEKNIVGRIENLLKINYPRNLIEIIVASDGSTDRTNESVKEISCKNNEVILIPFETQKGRAHIHNESVKRAKGDIVVFTDAETRFESDFLEILIPHFSVQKVGCVSARLYYRNTNQSSITESASIYWKYEELIRKLESDLGILAFGTGAALAIRRKIYKPIGLAEDIDRVATINVKSSGYQVKYEPLARAYDYIESDEKKAHIARVRKTSRAFKDVLLKLLKINPFKNPTLFISVFFHKTSRHLTPFYMICIFILNIILLNKSRIYYIIFLFQMLFYTFALVGWILEKKKKKLMLFVLPYNFVLLNISRFLGVIKSIFGPKITTYN